MIPVVSQELNKNSFVDYLNELASLTTKWNAPHGQSIKEGQGTS